MHMAVCSRRRNWRVWNYGVTYCLNVFPSDWESTARITCGEVAVPRCVTVAPHDGMLGQSLAEYTKKVCLYLQVIASGTDTTKLDL